MSSDGMTGVPCVCGKTHRFTPSAMAALLLIGETGDLHYVVGKGEIRYRCLYNVLANLPKDDARLAVFRGAIRYVLGETTHRKGLIQGNTNGKAIKGYDRKAGRPETARPFLEAV